ncbi:MAG: hypothetical protein M3R08_06390, partial [Bacteroidota bacterium]|nr:hypothetical protein [Bacteroidota bacterium]
MSDPDQRNISFHPALQKVARRSLMIVRYFIGTLGLVALIMIALAFTPIPFEAHHALASTDLICDQQNDLIVILGGSGMPSGPELLRLHYGAMQALSDQKATVVVIHPKDTAVMDAMVQELVLRGISPDRIQRVMEG